ncbi:putative ribonuclease H-like domain-containing protein [Tanacetum coccineum]
MTLTLFLCLNLIPIPSVFEGISDDACDVPFCENPFTFDALKDHSEILSDLNDDDTSSDDNDFEDIEYVSLEEVNDVDQEENEFELEDILQIQDVILREKLLNISRLITNIKSLNDNHTPDRVLSNAFLSPIFVTDSNSFFEKYDTSFSFSDNSLLGFKTFSDHTEEMRSDSTTTHANNSLPEYDSFLFEVEPDQGGLTSVVMDEISDNLTNDPLLELPEFGSFHFGPSFPRPPSKPQDVEICLNFEPDTPVIKIFDELNEDECFYPVGGTDIKEMDKNKDKTEHGIRKSAEKRVQTQEGDSSFDRSKLDKGNVYRNKKDERGIVFRNKERLVAQGYTQEKGINYDEVFAPVARIEAIRLFLAYASFIGFIVYQMDLKSAFLYDTIEEEVYVCQPPGFEDPQFSDKVYKVEKALYGLHQAPRAWYETLSTYLLENRFRRGIIDKTLFIKKNKGDILKHSIETNKALLKDEEAEDVDVHLYRSMIGSLMYLTTSRPDIMFAVCACARDSPFDLEAFSDSDYAGASLHRKSTTGCCQFLCKRLISWQCKKQTVVANSTTEAEYVDAANCYG